MNMERRQLDRENLRQDIPGLFEIEVNGNTEIFSQVNDVSISGMGIKLQHPLVEGQVVVIRYSASDFSLKLQAVISWCTKKDDDFYVGVEFMTEDVDTNVLFFMTLREYIDDFGETF